MGGVPVGAYEVGRLANIGLNHWSLDAGGGYTYLDTKAGRELSIVGGVTYNFENEDTNYQNGVDGHIDWAASQFLNEQLHIGLVGYIYYQLSGDSGEARCSATSRPASIPWDRRPDISFRSARLRATSIYAATTSSMPVSVPRAGMPG